MTLLDSLILGIVEGLTEFLPISSTAHLILTADILGLDHSAFLKTFEIAIQSGAILAVLVVYWRKFLDLEIIKKILAAFIPTAIVGFALYAIIKEHLLGNISVVLWALAIGGVALILFEKYYYKSISNENAIQDIKGLSYKKALYIGLIQSVAVIPGVSRSAATIVGGLLAGMSRYAIVEFSFLLAVPTIAGATALDLFKNYNLFSANESGILAVGFLSAFFTAIIGIKFLLSYVKNKTFVGFGIYRVLLVIVFIATFL